MTVQVKLINADDREVSVRLQAGAVRDLLVIRDSRRAEQHYVRVFKREAENVWREISFGTYDRDLASMANWWKGT